MNCPKCGAFVQHNYSGPIHHCYGDRKGISRNACGFEFDITLYDRLTELENKIKELECQITILIEIRGDKTDKNKSELRPNY